MTPKRIQRSRAKGWRMPTGAVYVGRPTKWGNPWRVGEVIGADMDSTLYGAAPLDAELAVELYRAALFAPPLTRKTITGLEVTTADVRAELRGHDLACWCALDAPCHADVLLEIANS